MLPEDESQEIGPPTFVRQQYGQIAGVELLSRNGVEDTRGCSFELYRQSWGLPSYQRHTSTFSWFGAFRGLWVLERDRRLFTPLFGAADFVMVDLRRGSNTLSKVVRKKLSWNTGESLMVPPGVAVGYLATSRHVIVQESSTSFDPPETVGSGVSWQSPAVRQYVPVKPIVSSTENRLPHIEEYLAARREGAQHADEQRQS